MGSRTPVTQPARRELDLRGRRLLGLLVEREERQQHLSVLALPGEQDTVDHPLAVGADLEQLAAQMSRRPHTLPADLPHRGQNRRLVFVGDLADELQYGPISGSCLLCFLTLGIITGAV